jgi:hypothetical protein
MSDWAAALMSALDGVEYGIVVLGNVFQARFINPCLSLHVGIACTERRRHLQLYGHRRASRRPSNEAAGNCSLKNATRLWTLALA